MKNPAQLEHMLGKAEHAKEHPRYGTRTYEEGVYYALLWVKGEIADNEDILEDEA